MKVYVNGKLVDSHKATLSIFDRGFLYGDGAFESLCTKNSQPFLLEEHLKRLFKSLKLLKIKAPLSSKALKQAVFKTLAANKLKEAYLKIIVTRGQVKAHGLSTKNQKGKSTLIIIVEKAQAIQPLSWKAIVSSARKANAPSSRIKSLCYLDNVLAKAEAERVGADEAFLLDEKGNLTEGTVSNIFIAKHQTIYTPSLASPILPGITRQLVIKIAKQSALRVIEKSISPKELYNADECFVTLSGPGIIPINGQAGPITQKLISLYGKST